VIIRLGILTSLIQMEQYLIEANRNHSLLVGIGRCLMAVVCTALSRVISVFQRKRREGTPKPADGT
jgi:hypothetical protein